MAIKRQMNWLGSMRVDVPHLRMVESAVAADFQTLCGTVQSGNRALVVHGFAVKNAAASVGTPASNLVLETKSGALLHGTASEAGAIYAVASNQPDETLGASNPNFGITIIGQFTPSSTNYVAVDLLRTADLSTEDAAVFKASDGTEFTQTVPLARTLNYYVYISTSDFSATTNRAPVAKVVTDGNNNVVSITDCRNLFLRLGLGGVTPNTLATFSWLNRNEATSTDPFTGGDKDIGNQYDWNRALMSRVWEVGGGEHWYSLTADREVLLVRDQAAVFANNENFEISGGNNIHWQGLYFYFGNSTAIKNSVQSQLINSAGLTDLAVNECIYVDVSRATNGATIVALKGSLLALGAPTVPGSRQILAWRTSEGWFSRGSIFQIGSFGPHATTTAFGTVKLYSTYIPDPLNPVVSVVDASGSVAANGVSRPTAGALAIGTLSNDTSVSVSRAGILTTVYGTFLGGEGIKGTLAATGSIAVEGDGTGATTNAIGVKGTGKGTGQGVLGVLSSTASVAVEGNASGGATDAIGVKGTGKGAFTGVQGYGGNSDGIGVQGQGGTTNGAGILGLGAGTGSGVNGTGGGNSGYGVSGTGGSTGGIGVKGQGTGAGLGVDGIGGSTDGTGTRGTGGATNGIGVFGQGTGFGQGVYGHGGPTGGSDATGIGVEGEGGATNGIGVVGLGTGLGRGVKGTGGAGGASTGVEGIGGSSGGIGVVASGTGAFPGLTATGGAGGGGGVFTAGGGATPTNGAIRLVIQNAPSGPLEGDMWTEGITPNAYLKIYLGGAIRVIFGPV